MKITSEEEKTDYIQLISFQQLIFLPRPPPHPSRYSDLHDAVICTQTFFILIWPTDPSFLPGKLY